jgi:hypothetical protein
MSSYVYVSQEEFDRFKTEAKAKRWGWPAVLSTNRLREVWPPPGRGYTLIDDRRRLHGQFPFLREVVDAYLDERPRGGRFFVDERLAWYKPEAGGDPLYPIALFRIGE